MGDVFFFNDTATTEIYTLSLHDALPICSANIITSDQFLEFGEDHLPDRIVFVGGGYISFEFAHIAARAGAKVTILHRGKDRKSTRLNSSHANISYAVFCLKKKKKAHVTC